MTPPPPAPAPDAPLSGAPANFGRIAVGIDFSASSRNALALARSRFAGAELLLVHVVDARAGTVPDLSTGGLAAVGPYTGVLGTLTSADQDALRDLALDGENIEVVTGDPAGSVVEAAMRWGAALIVVGTHSQGAVEHFMVGSVAEQIVRRSPLPVLTVRHPQGGGKQA